MTDPIIIADLNRCTPATALSPTPRIGYWHTLPYEAEGISGAMILAGPECNAPPLTLPLGVQGWHAIHLGVWTHRSPSTVKVKLSGDTVYTLVTTRVAERWSSNWWTTISETFWIFADLTGQDLHIAQITTGEARNAALAYVKLEPLTAEQVRAIQQERIRQDTRRLVAYNDAWSFVFSRGPTTAEEICEEIAPLRHTDFQKLIWDFGGGSNTQYFSNVGDYCYPNIDALHTDFGRRGERVAVKSFTTLKEKGIDPFDTAIRYAHSLGLEVHGSYRVGAWVAPPTEAAHSTGGLYEQHPEWRCVDWDGRPIARLSYAFPGVQDFVLSLFREVVGHGVDGITLVFIRGLPIMLYEPPLVESFRQQYGVDPRQLPQDDSRWLAHKAAWTTDFMRRVRHEMDQAGRAVGRRIQVSAHVLNTVPYNLSFGLDIGAWAREGLVDFIIPNPTRDRGPQGDSVDVDVAAFAQLLQGTQCKLFADVLPRNMPPEEFRQKALAYYQAGTDGLAFWDCDNGRMAAQDQWSMVRRLGHKDDLAGWAPDQWPAYRKVSLSTVGGLTMDRHSPYWYG